MESQYEGLKVFPNNMSTNSFQSDVKHMKQGPIENLHILIAGMWQYKLKKLHNFTFFKLSL